MDYSLSSSSIKGKEDVKMTINPTTNLEREFFKTLFANGGVATIETNPSNDEITIVKKEKPVS